MDGGGRIRAIPRCGRNVPDQARPSRRYCSSPGRRGTGRGQPRPHDQPRMGDRWGEFMRAVPVAPRAHPQRLRGDRMVAAAPRTGRPAPDRRRKRSAGHADVPGSSEREDRVIQHLRARFGHVSCERAVSGPGLENLYGTIAAIDGQKLPQRDAAAITQAGLEGSCATCRAALDMVCALLGAVTGNIALTYGARGGVFIAGGIAPRILAYLERSEFRARFEDKGRMRPYLAAIPTSVIVHPDATFVGLQALAVQSDA